MPRTHADGIFTDWGGVHAPLSIIGALANLQNTMFRNMHLHSEVVDVSFGGGVRFDNVSLANVALEHGAVVSTSANDYTPSLPCDFLYDAFDDLGYDVHVMAVPEEQQGVFGEEFRILEGVMSDCLSLGAPKGVLLPGCPAASVEKREQLCDGKTLHDIANDYSVFSAVPGEDASMSHHADNWMLQAATAPFESLLLWNDDAWLASVQLVRFL